MEQERASIPLTVVTTAEAAPSLSPDSTSLESISCGNCVSACCREGNFILLSEHEATELREAGTNLNYASQDTQNRAGTHHTLLETVGKVLFRRPGRRQMYELLSDCGNLVEDQYGSYCDVYGQEEQPAICSQFQEGGYQCRQMRVSHGVDSQRSFDNWLDLTARLS